MSSLEETSPVDLESTQIHVLHVDDDPDIADVAATFVEREDDRFCIETTTSAKQGLDRLADTEFDCIVSDYDMPEQNGIEFLEAVRLEYPEIPFILYTGKGSEEVASEAISAGVTDYLQKESGTSQYTVLANRIANAVEQYWSKHEVEASRKRLSLFFDQSPLGVIEWNEDFEVARINERANETLGYSDDDLLGESWERIVPESDSEAVEEVVKDLLEAEGGFHSINENVRGDGERIICEWHNRVVTDDSGETVAIFSQFQDITERKERERELEQYEAYLEGSTDIITVLDDSGTVTYQSPAVERILGYEADELVGENGFDLVHPDDEDEVYEAFTDLVTEPGGTVTVECRFRTADGEWRWLEVRGRNLLDHDAINGIVTNNRDITEKKKRERELQAVRRQFDAVLANTKTPMFMKDADGEYIFVNQEYRSLFGLQDREIIGRTDHELHPPEMADRVRKNDQTVIERGEHVEAEERIVVDGEERAYISTKVPIYDTGRHSDPDEPVAVFGVATDITERKEREQALEEANALLSTLVETLPAGVLAEDASRNIVTVNQHLFELFDIPCTPEGVVGADCERMAEEISEMFVESEQFVEGVNELVSEYESTRNEELALQDGRTFARSHEPMELRDGLGHLWVYRDITDQKEREQQLQQSQQLVEALSSALSDYFFIYDADGVYLDVITGWANGPVMYEPEELIGQSVDDVLPAESAELVETAITQARTTNTIQTVEYSVNTRHGPYWYEGHIAPIPDGYDGTDAVLLTARDVTDRRRREDALRQLQERTQQLMQTTTTEETAHVAVETARTVLDAELSGVHLLADDQQILEPVAFVDTTRAEFDDGPTYDRTAESDPTSAVVWDAFESGEQLVIDDTREYDGLAEVTPVRSAIISPIVDRGVFIVSATEPDAFDDNDKALVDILATSLVSALNRVEREIQLREREQQLTTERDRLYALFEMIPEPVAQIRFDEDDPVVVDINTAFKETFDYEADAITGSSINDVIVSPDRYSEAEQLDERVRAEGAVKQEVRRLTAEGVGDFLFRSVPVGEPGETDEYFGLYVDVSTQKAYERDLERQNERLDEFASVVSHDLRNPLHVATGRLELAQEECDSEHLDTIDTALERIDRIIEDVLWLAREGRDIGSLKPIAMQDVVGSSWKLVGDDTNGATLRYASDDRSLPTIEADEDRFFQLLENLFRNALEHGGENVTVTFGTLADGFYIEDDGIGIPEDEREDVFNAGYSTSEEGTGFGLRIVKQIAEAHGWDIHTTESADGGARFEITGVEFAAE